MISKLSSASDTGSPPLFQNLIIFSIRTLTLQSLLSYHASIKITLSITWADFWYYDFPMGMHVLSSSLPSSAVVTSQESYSALPRHLNSCLTAHTAVSPIFKQGVFPKSICIMAGARSSVWFALMPFASGGLWGWLLFRPQQGFLGARFLGTSKHTILSLYHYRHYRQKCTAITTNMLEPSVYVEMVATVSVVAVRRRAQQPPNASHGQWQWWYFLLMIREPLSRIIFIIFGNAWLLHYFRHYFALPILYH